MRTSLKRNTVAVASAALLLAGLLSGCSGDDKDNSADDTSASESKDSKESDSKDSDSKDSKDADSKDSDSKDEDTTKDDEKKDDEKSSDGGDFCTAGADISMDDLGDMDTLLDLYSTMDPPAEIADDWQIFLDGMEATADLSEQMKDLDPSDPDYLDELGKLSDAGIDDEFMDASTRITEWMTDNC